MNNITWSEEELKFLNEYYPHKNNELLRDKLHEINLKNGLDFYRNTSSIIKQANLMGLIKTDYYRKQLKIQTALRINKFNELLKFKHEEAKKRFITLSERSIKNIQKSEKIRGLSEKTTDNE